MKSSDDRNDVHKCGGQKTNGLLLLTLVPPRLSYILGAYFKLLGMQASRPPTSFWDSFTDTVYLLFNTPLVEPETPQRPMTIPLKALPALHTPFSRRMVLDDLESASGPPAST